MKRWLKSTISIILGAMILVTGSGLSLAKMVCTKSGFTQITLNEPDDCCKHDHEHAPVSIEEKCCDISSMDVDILHYLVSATQNIQKSYVSVELPASLIAFDVTGVTTETLFRELNTFTESSTPPIRVLTKSFLI